MSATLLLEIRDLTLNPQLADPTLEHQLHAAQKLRHRQGGIRSMFGLGKQIHARICHPHGK